jgi:DNA-directed RNA polymerase subunit M/transcription elongation factor TFIIS
MTGKRGGAVCPKCGQECAGDWKFCPHCGADLTQQGSGTIPIARKMRCPKCGATYDSRTRFCLKDGATLVG